MDRQVVQIGAVPQDVDVLLTNKDAMVGLGYLIAATLGTSVSVDGLACTPTTPASMSVQVGPGAIHSLQNVDGTAYGSLPADTTNQVMKQGLNPSTQTLACPAPAATGQSVVYLVQAAYQDTDSGAAVLPYYNASNPGVPWAGPNNTGVSQNTVRKGVCLVGVKAGVAAATGSQATPAPDAGFTGLYAVTVANGQTAVASGNVVRLATAPFVGPKLPNVLAAIQQDSPNYAEDASTAPNAIIVSLSPAPAYLAGGMPARVKVARTSTGPTVMSVNGGANVACVTPGGGAFGPNTVLANGIYTFVYDAYGTRWQLQGFASSSATGLLPANNLSDVASPPAALANLGGAPLASPALTGAPTAPTAGAGTSTTQLATTAFVNGTALTLAPGTTAVTQGAGDSWTRVATTAFVNSTALTLANGTTAATQGVGNSSTLAATTAFVNPGSSQAANGWELLPSGLIRQWGYVSQVGTSGVTITLPRAFPNSFFAAFATHAATKGSSIVSLAVNQNGLTQLDITANANAACFWQAIGN